MKLATWWAEGLYRIVEEKSKIDIINVLRLIYDRLDPAAALDRGTQWTQDSRDGGQLSPSASL